MAFRAVFASLEVGKGISRVLLRWDARVSRRVIQCAAGIFWGGGGIVLQGAGELWIGGSGSGHYDGRPDISGPGQPNALLLNTTQREECENAVRKQLAGGSLLARGSFDEQRTEGNWWGLWFVVDTVAPGPHKPPFLWLGSGILGGRCFVAHSAATGGRRLFSCLLACLGGVVMATCRIHRPTVSLLSFAV